MNKKPFVSAILLAGGIGKRVGADLPKQFLPIMGKEMVLYSFETMIASNLVDEVIVVCAPSYRSVFPPHPKFRFAHPGAERQDSVRNALEVCDPACDFLVVHDTARPFLPQNLLQQVLDAAFEHGAAVVGLPVKFTVKQSRAKDFVDKTLPREDLWEIQTPQVIRKDWMEEGFKRVEAEGLTVTDDVSLAELLGHPVKLVPGDERLFKVTTPIDLQLANVMI